MSDDLIKHIKEHKWTLILYSHVRKGLAPTYHCVISCIKTAVEGKGESVVEALHQAVGLAQEHANKNLTNADASLKFSYKPLVKDLLDPKFEGIVELTNLAEGFGISYKDTRDAQGNDNYRWSLRCHKLTKLKNNEEVKAEGETLNQIVNALAGQLQHESHKYPINQRGIITTGDFQTAVAKHKRQNSELDI